MAPGNYKRRWHRAEHTYVTAAIFKVFKADNETINNQESLSFYYSDLIKP